jgi:hypothetical protein
MRPSQTDRRDRPCDPATRRRVIVDRHRAAEQPDDEEAGRDDRQRTAGRDASEAPELLKRREQHRHGGERPDTVQRGQRGGRTGRAIL